jgi:hypothetical protein
MTGPLTLSGNATSPLNPVTLQQVQTGGVVQPGGLSTAAVSWLFGGNITADGYITAKATDNGTSVARFAFTVAQYVLLRVTLCRR